MLDHKDGIVAIAHDPILRYEHPELVDAVAGGAQLAVARDDLQRASPLGRPLRSTEWSPPPGSEAREARAANVTFLLADISPDLTHASHRRSHQVDSDLVSHRTMATNSVVAHGGSVLQVVGSGVMALFDGSDGRVNPGAAAVAAAMDIRASQRTGHPSPRRKDASPLRPRISVSTGPTAKALGQRGPDDAPSVELLELAWSLQEIAGFGETLLSEATVAELGDIDLTANLIKVSAELRSGRHRAYLLSEMTSNT